uniref:Uncharacterized protein n=1 Tax=Arundo donax TaxID=35708 RepID=A0A0A8ZLV8_ARUDO
MKYQNFSSMHILIVPSRLKVMLHYKNKHIFFALYVHSQIHQRIYFILSIRLS